LQKVNTSVTLLLVATSLFSPHSYAHNIQNPSDFGLKFKTLDLDAFKTPALRKDPHFLSAAEYLIYSWCIISISLAQRPTKLLQHGVASRVPKPTYFHFSAF
jgi:hypothetical protein